MRVVLDTQKGPFTLLTCAEQLMEVKATLRKPGIAARIKPTTPDVWLTR
jgi:hypothetical protein